MIGAKGTRIRWGWWGRNCVIRNLISAAVIVVTSLSSAWAAGPATLKSLRAIHALSNVEASQSIPVSFEATVTYFRWYERTLFVQDGDVAIYVAATANVRLVPGDRVLVRGTTHESFRPYVQASSITVLRHLGLPKQLPASFDELIRAQVDCRLVTVHAVVLAADSVLSSDVRSSRLQMLADGGNIDAVVDSNDRKVLDDLVDAEVEVTGTASGRFDGKMQETGILLHVSSFDDVRVLQRGSASPWSLPVTPMDEILKGYHVKNLTRRVRVDGTITYYQPGSAVVLQSGAKSLWLTTQARIPLQIGDQADATGLPDVRNGFLNLTHSEIRSDHLQTPIRPQSMTWSQLSSSHNIFDLVSIEGELVMEAREAAQDEYVLVSDGQPFSAIIQHPTAISLTPPPLPPMKQIPLGSRVRVAGICIPEDSNPFNPKVPFNILMRSFDDIAVVARPPLLNIRNLILLVGLLLIFLFAAGIRAWVKERKIRQQNASAAYTERLRSRILEDISGSRPLAEIIEQITELVSFRLQGAVCWCQIVDGALLGNCPRELISFRTVHALLPARSGPPLGIIYAAFDPLTKPRAIEFEALSTAAAQAALAIETRRLYSDLQHRTEFDHLTEIHNRFSLERYLDTQIEEARQRAGVFGLIYIDIDKFKHVNDLYGHHIGDLYLHEATLRMKEQLRSHDMLARLGGDEFAALVPMVHSHAEVEEIARRLGNAFDDPFNLEEYVLRGSASVGIAVYPESGTTREGLLIAADSAMYEAKQTRKQSMSR
jgi:diguanylate cyclase (GGDEF)-like protein